MTGDPLRLLNDPTLGAALRADLGVASHGAAYDVEAGLARFESTLAVNMARGTGAVGGGVSSGFAVGALVLAGGLAAALGWQLAGPPSPAPTHALVARAQPQAARRTLELPTPGRAARVAALDEHDVAVAAVAIVADEPVAIVERPAIKSVRAPKLRGTRGVRNEAPAVREPAAYDALREARELNAARGLLGEQPALALALAETGAAEFRAGTFAPEWEGVAVLALFELGRVEQARERGEAFLQAHPSGTYAPRIRQAIDALTAATP